MTPEQRKAARSAKVEARGARKAAKRGYHHGNLRRALMDEALLRIREGGIDDLSLRSLARGVGVSHQAPYSHFKDRTALLKTLAREGMSLMDERMAQLEEAAGDDPARRLVAIGKAYVTFAVEHPDYYATMALPELANDPACDDDSEGEELQGNTWDRLLSAVVAAQAAGELPHGDPVIYAVYLWSLVHGLTGLWAEGPLRYMPQASGGLEPLADAVLSACLESLRKAADDEVPVAPTAAPAKSEDAR